MRSENRRVRAFVAVAALFSLTIYLYGAPLSLPLQQGALISPVSKSTEKFAYATFLRSSDLSGSGNLTDEGSLQSVLEDINFKSTRLLNYQIRHADRTRTRLEDVPFLVLVQSDAPQAQVVKLEAEGATIVVVEPIELPAGPHDELLSDSPYRELLTKLRIWQQVDYDKILYLDSDAFLLQDLDSIFLDSSLSTMSKTRTTSQTDSAEVMPPETYLMAASSDTRGRQSGWKEQEQHDHLCACFMLLSPSLALFDYYLSMLATLDAPLDSAHPEQDLLRHVHERHGSMPWKEISVQWSTGDSEDDGSRFKGAQSVHIESTTGENAVDGSWKTLVEEMEIFYVI
ncbi:glycosyltransferase family 8 protein [Aaosphaeria arxii CBS 175.79]|uniref:Glycosyltransferase family 8 protein n=1 Tax=Aaosphaeria arxii CBS 175.79 TaxID=1450172 RepID=A0A6A5Y6B5_9PLEO|nr:glycosyltransferase family 8 protein [Aaosphaeria arxii CBS 175.79]KAF2020836.1 glycosyltransferase family 8 protein [Aaosphaeria arxii CBS 175.79]